MKKTLTSTTAVSGLLAITTQFYFVFSRKITEGFSPLYAVNHYFSYFTVIINTAVVVFLYGSILFPDSKLNLWFKKPRHNGGLAVYILIVGLIFYTLLFKSSKAQGLELLATHVLHGFMPTSYLLIWFLYFKNSDLKYAHCFHWLIVPFIYFIYILTRGALIGAYPYFFLNVDKLGYALVAIYAAGILSAFMVMGALVVYFDKKYNKPTL